MFLVDNNTTGAAHFVQYTYLTGKSPIDFLGGLYRLHSMNTIFDPTQNGGNPTNIGCQYGSPTDQIGCLVQADPCSVGTVGDSGKNWGLRSNGVTGATQTAVGDCFVASGVALCSGPPYTGASCPACLQSQGQATIGNCGPASASGGAATAAGSDSIRIAQVYPNATTVTNLGAQALEYAISRKLYFVTAGGFPFLATTPVSGAADQNLAGELALAEFVSNATSINPILASAGLFALANQGDAGWNNPFCEDFDEQTVCGAASNRNACPDNSNGSIPPPSFDGGSPIPSFGSICGNGIQEPFEECDNGAANGSTGNACSSACRCNATFHYSQDAGVFVCNRQ
jgi:hypothetical protein